MRRTAVVALLVSACLIGVLVWQAVMRQRAYSLLIAEGDRALAADQAFLALEAYSGAIALRSDSMLAYLKRGETYRRQGESREALRDLRTAVHLDPTAATPLELLGDVNASLERYGRAEESYQAYLGLDERSPRVLYKLALVRHRLGRTSAALAPLRQAISVDDHFAEGYYLLGVCLHALNQMDESAASLERAVRIQPGMSAAREELAEVYTTLHREKDALHQFEALAALEPGRPERQVALGLAYGRAGRADMAVVTLRRVAEEHPEQIDVFVALGRVWLEAAKAHHDRVATGKAIEALNSVARQSPPDSEALLLLGRAQMLKGDAAAAENTLMQATAQLPVEPSAFLQLSLVAERAGHLRTARDALLRYTALSGDGTAPPDRAVHLGDLAMRLNEPAAAVTWYARATQGASAGGTAFVRLVETQLRTGDRAGALASLDRGLQRDPRDQALQRLQHALRPAAGQSGPAARPRGN